MQASNISESICLLQWCGVLGAGIAAIPAVRFQIGRNCPQKADYTVASGIMNVRLGYPVPLWENLVRTILFECDA